MNGNEPHRHCARQDSNLQPSDSKDACLDGHVFGGEDQPCCVGATLNDTECSEKPSDLQSESFSTPISPTGNVARSPNPVGDP